MAVAASPNSAGLGRLGRDLVRRATHENFVAETAAFARLLTTISTKTP
jgi:hypothetical protein